MTFSKYSEFQPLKEIVVGQGYPIDYFDNIDDSEVRDNVQRIFSEIEEDFQHLVKTLEGFGVTVRRPGLISKDEYQIQCENSKPPIPPLTPRDRQGVFGNKFVDLCDWSAYKPMIDYYRDQDPANFIESNSIIRGANNSCVFQMGRDVWFDESDFLTAEHSQWLEQNVLTDSNYRFHRMLTEGHGDCVFAVLKPGVILTSYHDNGIDYRSDFAGWKLHHVGTPSITREMQGKYWNFRNEFHPGGVWWAPGKDNLPKFSAYVDKYLGDWLGAVHESVFDVNCLVLDESHVIFSAYNREVFDYCRRHRIEPIISELRHSYFWDGGISCCTQDIRRRGGLETYL